MHSKEQEVDVIVNWIEENCWANELDTNENLKVSIVKVRPKITDIQKDILMDLLNNEIMKGAYPRQCGLTSILIWYSAFLICNNIKNTSLGIVCRNFITSSEFMDKLFENLQDKVDFKRKGTCVMQGTNHFGSTFLVVAGTDAKNFRGLTLTNIFCDNTNPAQYTFYPCLVNKGQFVDCFTYE